MPVPIEILQKIDNALEQENLSKGLQIIRDNALEIKKKQVKELMEIMEISKYKLVFIGAIGSGKTTAISHLFDLTDKIKVSKTVGKGKKKKSVKKDTIKELMTVGAGGTTIAEVVVSYTENENSYFDVEFVSEKELSEMVDSFCDQVITKDDKDKGGRLLAQEEERAFRNILKLTPTQELPNPENKILHEVKGDENKFRERIADLLQNVTNDVNKVISFEEEQSLINDEKKWLRDTFRKINVADIDAFSIPKRINIHLSQNIVGQNSPLKYFHSIIDTKGLDAARDKKSIDDYLKAEDTICIFTTRYEVAPDEKITHFIQKHLQDDLKNTHNRFITLILPRDDEPEKVIGYSGEPIGDWDEGIEYRKVVIRNTFSGLGIKFSDKNILHFDAFRYFEDGLPEDDYLDDIKDDKNLLINRVQDIIAYRKEMNDLLAKFEDTVDTIINGELNEAVIEKIKNAIEKIKSYRKLIVNVDFANNFKNEFDTQFWHWATKHAINKRHGVWEWKDIDLRYIGKELTKRLIKSKTIDYKKRISEIIEQLGNDESSAIFKSIANQLEIEFLTDYNSFVETIGKKIYNRLSNDEFEYWSGLWTKVLDESIKGSGFVYRMLQIYRNELADIQNFLKYEVETAWEKQVVDKILNFLGETDLKKKEMNNTTNFIDSIEIKNYFSIDEGGIKLENLSDKKEVYLVGENGSGKTIILQGIARALKGEQNIGAVSDVLKQNFRETPLFYAKDKNGYEYTNQSRMHTSKPYPYFYAYGINRLLLGDDEIDIKNDEVYTTLFNNKFNLINPVDWLRMLKLELVDYPDKLITLDTVSELLSELLEKDVKVYLKGSDVIFEERGTPLSFNQLSDGYKSSIVWISDLLARLSFHQPKANELSEFRGIVLVDEIGIYLHPSLKYSLIKKLTTKFSGIQWIFTTHSPIILLGASKDAAVYKVYKEKDSGTTYLSSPINISGYTANSLITSTIWNVPDFTTEGTELEEVSNFDNIYKQIHKKVAEQQKQDPSMDENNLLSLIEDELNKNK